MATITWDPLNKDSTTILFNNNLTAKVGGDTTGLNSGYVKATHGKTFGKWYWEIKIEEGSILTSNISFGVTSKDSTTINDPNHRIIRSSAGINIGDIIGFCLDLDNKKLKFFINGIEQKNNEVSLLDIEYYPFVMNINTSARPIVTANFGSSRFYYPIPLEYYSYDGTQGYYKILLLSDGQVKTYRENEQWLNINKGLSDISEQDYENYGIDLWDLPSIDVTQTFIKKSFISKNSSLLGSGQVFQQTIDTNKYKIKKITIK